MLKSGFIGFRRAPSTVFGHRCVCGADAAADFGVVDGLECGAGGGKTACSGKRRSEHFVLEQFLALFICGIAMYAVMYIAAAAAGRNSPNGHELLAAGCYLFCASALALVVGGADISGRMNLAAPFIAFATSLLGGCFADTAARGGLFAKLALLTPQGLCIAGTDGSVACLAVLAGAGVVLLALKRAALRVKFAERR